MVTAGGHHPDKSKTADPCHLLRIGGATFFGLTVPQLFRARATAAPAQPAKAKQVLLVWMYGGPSQIDMFDLIWLVLTLGLFGVGLAYLTACERM